MRTERGAGAGARSRRRAAAQRSLASPLLKAVALALLGFLALGLVGARQLAAASPTDTAQPAPTETPAPAATPGPSGFVSGRHVYDYGNLLSAQSAATAEALAAHIEAAGGGRVVIYTVADSGDLPDTSQLAQDWQIDGLLLTGQTDVSEMLVGPTLKAKLSGGQAKVIDDNSSAGPQTVESWILSTLARVDAFLSGTHVFDGAGVLDSSGKQQAETAATNLAGQLGATVYVDISLGGTDPSTAAFFNGAAIADAFDTKTLVIALAVGGGQYGGSVDSTGDLFGNYDANAPWKSDGISNGAPANGDLQAALLAAIGAVQKPPLIPSDAIPVIVFVVVIVIFSITAPFLWGPWLIRRMTGVSGPIKNALPGDAVIQSIADTGVTVSMPSVGPEAPEYKLGLQVTPSNGGAPYLAEVKALVPRIYIPMIVPGTNVGVLIDPANPMKMSVDFSRINQTGMGGASSAFGGASAFGGSQSGGMDVSFDQSGQPVAGDVAALAGAVRSGTLPTIKGSAAELLATGTHGTAIITTAQPLGKKVRDVNPAAEASHLDDPVWLFTLEVSLAGQKPFPAVFGHRVPADKLAQVAPGVKLAVAVGATDPSHEVAIDWDKSPIQ
jgi:uncharacterized membrane protein YgcG